MVVRDGNKVTIVDVTIPFEAGEDAFAQASSEKHRKYGDLIDWLKNQPGTDQVSLHTFVVGSLGAWDASNEETVKALGIPRNYTKLMSQLCTIRGSFYCTIDELIIYKIKNKNNYKGKNNNLYCLRLRCTAACLFGYLKKIITCMCDYFEQHMKK
jgi:hypothetical protein